MGEKVKVSEFCLRQIANAFMVEWSNIQSNGVLDLSDGYRVDEFVDLLKLAAVMGHLNGFEEQWIIDQMKSINPNLFE